MHTAGNAPSGMALATRYVSGPAHARGGDRRKLSPLPRLAQGTQHWRLIRQTDPRGKATTVTYDGLNRITTIVDALNGVTRFTYDPNGNLLTVTDARSGTTTYTYDSMDRVVSRTDPLGALETF